MVSARFPWYPVRAMENPKAEITEKRAEELRQLVRRHERGAELARISLQSIDRTT